MSAPRADAACRTADLADIVTFSSVDGPGNRLVVFLQGCNFDCIACHNPQTIPVSSHQVVDVDTLLARIRRAAPFIRGVTVSGGEATQQPEFVHALFAAMRDDPATAHLTRLVDSNGGCGPEVWGLLDPVMDGAMIDLKCLDPGIHQRMTGQPNDEVLASIHHLHATGKLHEVRLLLLAGVNDADDLLRRTAAWLASIDPSMRVKVIGLRLHGTRPHDPPLVEPTAERLQEAAAILRGVAPFDVTVI